MKNDIVQKKEHATHSLTVSRGMANNGLGEEPTVCIEIEYKSVYRLKRRNDLRFRFAASHLADIINLLQIVKHETRS